MTSIPPEIVDRIIDYVHDDPKTLIACSLVAKDWVPSAHLHLFEKMEMLTSRPGFELKELANLSPTPLWHCQEFSIKFGGYANPPDFMNFLQPLSTLPKRIDCFAALHTLRISGCAPPAHGFIEFLEAISERITTVIFTKGGLESSHDLWKILRLFPNLQNVHISDFGYSINEERELTVSRCYTPPIASFSFHTHCLGFVLEELAEPPFPLAHLKSLEIHHTDQPQRYLNTVAIKYQNAITRLKFSAHSTLGSDIPPHIGTYNCLQTLILGKLELFAAYPLGRSSIPIVPSFAWVTATIEQINSRLSRLVFEIAVTEKNDLNAISWEDIDAFLDYRPQFTDLKSVEAVFLDTIPTTITREPDKLRPGLNLTKDMMRRMRRTVKRGLMKCSTRGLRAL